MVKLACGVGSDHNRHHMSEVGRLVYGIGSYWYYIGSIEQHQLVDNFLQNTLEVHDTASTMY